MANNVLKQYLIKGYVINESRTLVTNENYINLINRVENIDLRLSRLERNGSIQNEKIFFDGKYFDARSFLKQLFPQAKNKITLIDPYSDTKTLDYLKVRDNGVEISLFTSSKAKLTQDDIDSFNLQYGGLQATILDSFHDRFLIIDDIELYHLGTSLNYLANKTFAITKMESDFINTILNIIR
ncbi:MAG: cell filamentation protein Fic [Bacilli bacterium]|nr:cell filamentation protein Fic [Bacilli bacterium]